MVCYIYCKINDRELLVNEDDPEDIKSYMLRSNQYDKVGKKYLRKVLLKTLSVDVKSLRIPSILINALKILKKPNHLTSLNTK